MKFMTLLIPSLVVLLACLFAGKPTPLDAPAADKAISFPAFDGLFGRYSKATESQKNDQFRRIKGTRVEWTGVVGEADSTRLYVRENASTIASDVRVEMLASERHKLASLDKGMVVTYRGKIESWGIVVAHSLMDGEIVSSRQVEPVEMYKLLTDTESAVVSAAR